MEHDKCAVCKGGRVLEDSYSLLALKEVIGQPVSIEAGEREMNLRRLQSKKKKIMAG